MPVESQDLRRVMGHFATGVTIITTRDREGAPVGLTANAVSSVSLDPPLVLFCLDKKADCYDSFAGHDTFAINILSAEQADLSTRFATKGAHKFEDVAYSRSEQGCPLLDRATGHLDCRVVERHEAGDHVIYIAHVESAEVTGHEPLLFFQGRYWRLRE